MEFELTEEQKQIKAVARDFCKREIDTKRIAEIEDKVFNAKTCEEVNAVYPRDLQQKLHDLGLRQLLIPAKYGGTAPETGAHVCATVACEEIGYHEGSIGAILGQTYALTSDFLGRNSNFTEEYLERSATQFLANPRSFMAAAVSEPDGGTDVHLPYDGPGGVLKVVASKDRNEWVINGNKMFCTGGAVADIVMVAVRTDKDGPITQSMSMFMVPTNTPGVSRTLNRLCSAELGGNAQFFFDNVRVPETALAGQVNKGWHGLLSSKWIWASHYLGEMQRLNDDMRDYAKQRVQGGKPIIQHSMVAAMLGEAAVDIEAVRAILYKAAWETDQWTKYGGPVNRFWSFAYQNLMKRKAWRLCQIAGEVYAGVGRSQDMPVPRFLRRIFAWSNAGTPPCTNAVMCSDEYDERYSW